MTRRIGQGLVDLSGRRFWRWTVVKRAPSVDKHPRWECICDCGTKAAVYGALLRSGRSSSCGCFRRELTIARETTHGLSKTPLQQCYYNMKKRCDKPNNPAYKDYGGRGIRCLFKSFEEFAGWAARSGYAPHLMLDRMDNNGNYEPSNCRWVTRAEQNRNQRDNVWVEFGGTRMVLSEAIRAAGLKSSTVHMRIKYGWSVERALNTQVQRCK